MADEVGKRELTRQEREERIAALLAELKELQVSLRSDWHAGFEALLRIEAHRHAGSVRVSAEEEIGVAPPRADFVILEEDEAVEWDKAIFGIFRRINIIEYKNPNDSLNRRAIRKALGYANLYIGNAEREGDRPEDQVTVSIFRAVKNQRLFREMEKAGTLEKGEVPGIYHVRGYTDLPFQIIVTDELEGEEYAAYRALTDRAGEADVERIIEGAKQEVDGAVKEYYRVLLGLVMDKNPVLAETIRKDEEMSDVLMDMLEDKVEARVKAAESATERRLTVDFLNGIMARQGCTASQAMDFLAIPEEERGTYAELLGGALTSA